MRSKIKVNKSLLQAVHTDNFDGSDEMINEEKKVAYFVKKYAVSKLPIFLMDLWSIGLHLMMEECSLE